MAISYGTNNTSLTAKSNADEKKVTEDVTSKVLGDFGRWQLVISISMALLKLPTAWYQLNIIFLAPPQEFWCKKPDMLSKLTEKQWREICAPATEEHPCLIYDPDLLASSPDIDRSIVPLVPCREFVYDLTVFSRTIVSEWNLVCSRHWLVHLAQCVMMWGVLMGGIVYGAMADRYGRRYPLMLAIVTQSVSSWLSGLLTHFWLFMVNRFILALSSGGIVIISFVMSMEVVSGKWRTIIPVICQLPFGLGNAIMAGLSFWLRDWRKLEFGLAFLSTLFLLYYFWIPESPRWLLATGQTDKALEVLRAAAYKNNRPLTRRDEEQILQSKIIPKVMPGFMVFMKSKNMRMKTILLAINWFCTGLAFYTFSQYMGSIAENIFVTVAVSGIISIPGAVVCVCVVLKFGRKSTVAGFQLVTAMCFLFILLIPRDVFSNDWPRLLCAGVGMAGMAGSVPALYLFTAELFPTLGRNVGVGGVTTFARIGSMVAPILVSLDDLMVNLTLILLAVMSFSQLLLVLPLPETKDSPLPDTLEEAENFKSTYGKSKKRSRTRSGKPVNSTRYILTTNSEFGFGSD